MALTATIHNKSIVSGGNDGAMLRKSGKQYARKDNYAATTNPGVSNDSSQSYEVGSMWLNVSAGTFYVCKDASVGAASWVSCSGSALGGSDTHVQYNSGGTALGGSANFTYSAAAGVTITAPSTSVVPLNIVGANGQTANLLNVTSYGGTAGDRFSIASTGATTINAASGNPLTVQSGSTDVLTAEAVSSDHKRVRIGTYGYFDMYSTHKTLRIYTGSGNFETTGLWVTSTAINAKNKLYVEAGIQCYLNRNAATQSIFGISHPGTYQTIIGGSAGIAEFGIVTGSGIDAPVILMYDAASLGYTSTFTVGKIAYTADPSTATVPLFRITNIGNAYLAGTMGINTTVPNSQLSINSATGDCLRLIYNDATGTDTNKVTFAVSSGGNLTITPSSGKSYISSGAGATLYSSNIDVSNNLTVGNNLQASNYLNVSYKGIRITADTTVSLQVGDGYPLLTGSYNGDTTISPGRNTADNYGDVILAAGGGNRLRVYAAATSGMRQFYSASYYCDYIVSSSGDLTITPNGGDVTISGTLQFANGYGNGYVKSSGYDAGTGGGGLSFYNYFGNLCGTLSADNSGGLTISGLNVVGSISTSNALHLPYTSAFYYRPTLAFSLTSAKETGFGRSAESMFYAIVDRTRVMLFEAAQITVDVPLSCPLNTNGQRLGTGSTLSGDYVTAIGSNQVAVGGHNVLVGTGARIDDSFGVAIGSSARCYGERAAAMGYLARASAYAMALGMYSDAYNGSGYGVAVGYYSAGITYGVGVGYYALAQGSSVAIGANTGHNSYGSYIAIGREAVPTASYQAVFGSATYYINTVNVNAAANSLVWQRSGNTFLTVDTSQNAAFSQNVSTASDKAFYLGDPATDGTWRINRSGNNLIMERRESGSYVTKQTITP